ncbi:MAG: UDP-N-acetylmuramoyl-L-alanine--D-glutamate ligase [bacterium]
MEFSNKNILILGLGISNLAVMEYLKDKNVGQLTVTDLKDEAKLGEIVLQAKKIFPGAKFVLGRHNEDDFIKAGLIVKSPSITSSVPLVQKALAKGVPVESDVSLFFKLCPSQKIIGVTGTKGKTTTATFLAQVLEAQGKHTILAGNMGIPVMSQLSRITKNSWVVLELSSYMAESLEAHRISPRVAVYTNIFPDHLDQYKSFDDYVVSKKGLYRYQGENDITLFGASCPNLKKLQPEVVARLICYSRKDLPKDIKLKLMGGHNRDNLAAGFVSARELKMDIGKVAETAEHFTGLEHRMENLGEINEREFINNSAATNPGGGRQFKEQVFKK